MAKKFILRDQENWRNSVQCNLKHYTNALWNYAKYMRTSSRSKTIALQDDSGYISELSSAIFLLHSFFSIGNLITPCTVKTKAPIESTRSLPVPKLTLEDVLFAINELAPRKLSGEGGIPAFIVKGFRDIFAPVLLHIFNISRGKCISSRMEKCSSCTST